MEFVGGLQHMGAQVVPAVSQSLAQQTDRAGGIGIGGRQPGDFVGIFTADQPA